MAFDLRLSNMRDSCALAKARIVKDEDVMTSIIDNHLCCRTHMVRFIVSQATFAAALLELLSAETGETPAQIADDIALRLAAEE